MIEVFLKYFRANLRSSHCNTLDRLEAHLIKNNDFDSKVKAMLPEVWLPFIADDTPIILDLSDIAEPFAKKMDYLATVRDGSTGELVNGYWLVELYASLSRKNPVPVLLEPFSHEEPYSPGQNPVVLASQGFTEEKLMIKSLSLSII